MYCYVRYPCARYSETGMEWNDVEWEMNNTERNETQDKTRLHNAYKDHDINRILRTFTTLTAIRLLISLLTIIVSVTVVMRPLLFFDKRDSLIPDTE